MWTGRARALITVLRDLLLLVAPGAAFIIEALKKEPSTELLILYLVLMGAPGVASSLFLARNGDGGAGLDGGGIGSASPPLPPAQQPPPPPSTSSTASSGTEGTGR